MPETPELARNRRRGASWHHVFELADDAVPSALPWDSLPDLIGLHAGQQLPPLPVVRLHALLPPLTTPWFELELHEPTLTWIEVDGSNVRTRYGIRPRRIVWTTHDPFTGLLRSTCRDLVLNRPCS